MLILAKPAVNLVQSILSSASGSQSSLAASLNGTVSGNILTAMFYSYVEQVNLNVTSNNGTTMALASGTNNFDPNMAAQTSIYLGKNNANGSVTVTFTPTPNFQFPTINLAEWSGLTGVDEAIANYVQAGSATTISAPTNAATTPRSLVLSIVTPNISSPTSLGSGMITLDAENNRFAYSLPTSVGIVTHTYNFGEANSLAVCIAAFN